MFKKKVEPIYVEIYVTVKMNKPILLNNYYKY